MGSITKRGDLQWQARVRRTGHKEQSETFDTYEEAERWVAMTEARLFSEGSKNDYLNIVTLGNLLKRYREEVTPTHKGEKQESDRLKRLEDFPIAKIALADLIPDDARQFRDDRLAEVSPGTVIREMNLVSSVIRHAISEWREYRGLRNPFSDVKRPKTPPRRERRIEEYGGENELEGLLEASDSEAFKDFLPIAVETAMRRGETTKILVRDVILQRRVIRLYDTKNGTSRTVPLSKQATEIAKRLVEGKKPDDPLFGIVPDSMTQAFGRARDRARKSYEARCRERGTEPDPRLYTDIRLHDMRHEATSRLFEKDLDAVEVSSITGHKSLQQLRGYAHLRAEKLVNKLD